MRAVNSGDRFVAGVAKAYTECEKVLLSKHEDYGPKNIANSPGGPLNGLRVRMHDKLARMNNLLDSGKTPKHESLRDTFLDMANYGIIGLLVVDGEWPGVPSAATVAAPSDPITARWNFEGRTT